MDASTVATHVSVIQYVLIFIVASLAGMSSILDEWQFHHPLVACTLMGLALGQLHTGIVLGGTLELLALGWANIGAAVAPDAALASTISALLVMISGQKFDVAIGLAIPLAAAGQVLAIIIRSIVVSFQHGADQSAKDGHWGHIDFYHWISLFLYSLRISVPTIIVAATAGTSAVKELIESIPQVITGGLGVAGGFIVVVGYAMIINMMRASHLMPFLFLGFTIAAFTTFNLVGMGIVGLCFALIYISLHPKYYLKNNPVAASGGQEVVNYADDILD